MKLILLGAPGAGKGTQAELLTEKLEIPTISTGNILRAAVREGTPVGLKAKALMESGSLVPNEVILGIVEERISKDDCKNGYILDGVPRNLSQAKALPDNGIYIDYAVCIDVPDTLIANRMSGRRTCSKCSATFHVESNPPKKHGVCDFCGGDLIIRKDDMPETVKHRLEVYHAETEPLLDYYAGLDKLITVDGVGTPDEVTKRLYEALGI